MNPTPYQLWVLERMKLVDEQRALDREHMIRQTELSKRYRELMANEPAKLPQDHPKELSE